MSANCILMERDQLSPSKAAPPIAILGVPFDNVTTEQTIALIERMVESRQPHYLVTANVDFLVQSLRDIELRRILFQAHLVLCDGTPLLWASRLLGNPLPERVAGSDLVPLLLQVAATRSYRAFFLGGSPGTAEEVVERLHRQLPDLIIAGHYSPPFSSLFQMDHAEITRRIREAKPDILLVAFGCPKQEKWIAMHYRNLGVPVSVGVGATIDFLAGRLARAPVWMRKTGTEWIFRLIQEPRRLFRRYFNDLFSFSWHLLVQWWRLQMNCRQRPAPGEARTVRTETKWQHVPFPDWLDMEAVQRHSILWDGVMASHHHLLLDLANVKFIDSTGVGLLIRMQKRARITGKNLCLVAPSDAVQRALASMRLDKFFRLAPDSVAAKFMAESELQYRPVTITQDFQQSRDRLAWNGEITAVNGDEVWRLTESYLQCQAKYGNDLVIDLARVSFVDSTALGIMIKTKKCASKKGIRLTFCNASADVKNTMRLAQLEAFLLSD